MLKLAIKVGLSLVPTLLLLSAVEFACRYFWQTGEDRARAGFVIPDEELVWRLKPQAEGPLATNVLGFRDRELKEKVDTRILVLGDSVTWGDGVADAALIYTQVLEDQLLQAEAERSVDIVNFGVPGYATTQERRLLLSEGLKLQPDLVILQFCLNDVFEPFLTQAEFGGDNQFLGVDTRAAVQGLHGKMLRSSRAYERLIRFMQSRARDRSEYDVKKMTEEELSLELKEAWEVVLTELLAINEILKREEIPWLLLIAPYRFQLSDPASFDKPQRMLKNFAFKHKIETLNLLPIFYSVSSKYQEPLFNDQNHFSPFGHKVTAEAIKAWYTARKWKCPVRKSCGSMQSAAERA